ncbi:hypothetical protein RRG08_060108 [Elysia crispata]|uniref:N-acetyltransferase domain-containing protein n=1 Tax=Elysia crispata TaxID=231223 RepID=A0AAE1BD45_9GAST|nr:hypothetical protein RRG08_060108 [Elysia crispata]
MLRRYSYEMKRFASSANWLKGINKHIRKEPIIPYLERCQHEKCQSFHVSSLQNFSRRSVDKNDLSRFLIEIGTDPKEARYWLKNFMSSAEPSKVFMVISVDDEVMQNQGQLETFSSTIAFLYRNNMAPLIVYGNKNAMPSFKSMKDACIWNALKLSNMLEQQGVFTRVLYPGCGVIMGDSEKAGMPEFAVEQLKLDPYILRSDFQTGHLPILLSFGETAAGQMFAVDTWTLTSRVAQLLQPIKVMLVNSQGGFLDEHGKVIANINLPSDLSTVEQKPWKTPDKVEMMKKVNNLLADLPTESSVVITSADTMLRELFSHRGSGTFFRCTEEVHKHTSLEGMDLDRLRVLLHRSFKKTLSDSYFDDIESQIHAIYLSETYSGVAIILKGQKAEVNYLCKFAVTDKAQGQGIGELLWDTVRQAEPILFWRSKTANPINTWYFKKCEGSWNNPMWTVFWYGVQDPSLSSVLITEALTRPDSFDEGTNRDSGVKTVKEDPPREVVGSGAGK